MMPTLTEEMFVQYPCLGDWNDAPYQFAGVLTRTKLANNALIAGEEIRAPGVTRASAVLMGTYTAQLCMEG
jgi:hypothetical protein